MKWLLRLICDLTAHKWAQLEHFPDLIACRRCGRIGRTIPEALS